MGSKPKPQPMQPLPPPPAERVDPEILAIRRRVRASLQAGGRKAMVLTNPTGLSSSGTLGLPTLLGGK